MIAAAPIVLEVTATADERASCRLAMPRTLHWTATHLSADATKRLSDMTDAELAALEQRMIAAAPIVLEATADGDTGEPSAGDAEDSPLDGDA